MATRTNPLAQTNVSDASFRAWINEIHSGLTGFGWLQTSDTGQINFVTVTRPTAINTYQGYAVYKMNDSLQATTAVFMRLDFGTGAQTDVPAFKLQVAIGGTDGAGALTGQLGTQQTLSGNTANASSVNVRSAGTSSAYRMSFWDTNGGGNGFMFAIERDLDASGTETTSGVCVITQWVQAGSVQFLGSQFIPASGSVGTNDATWYALISTAANQTGGGNVGVAPVRVQYGPMRNPMRGVLVCARADFTPETTSLVTIYGAAHTYLFLRPATSGAKSLNTINSDCEYALLFE